jgi:hypothetical protein
MAITCQADELVGLTLRLGKPCGARLQIITWYRQSCFASLYAGKLSSRTNQRSTMFRADVESLLRSEETERSVQSNALRIQGLLTIMQGRWDVAAATLEEALVHTRAMPYPYAEAKALGVYSRLEATRGETAAARMRFKQALASCDWLGEGLYRKYFERDLAALNSSTRPAHP